MPGKGAPLENMNRVTPIVCRACALEWGESGATRLKFLCDPTRHAGQSEGCAERA